MHLSMDSVARAPCRITRSFSALRNNPCNSHDVFPTPNYRHRHLRLSPSWASLRGSAFLVRRSAIYRSTPLGLTDKGSSNPQTLPASVAGCTRLPVCKEAYEPFKLPPGDGRATSKTKSEDGHRLNSASEIKINFII